jgi:hypothetical protein
VLRPTQTTCRCSDKALHIMERIGDARAGFRSITEAIDTTRQPGA